MASRSFPPIPSSDNFESADDFNDAAPHGPDRAMKTKRLFLDLLGRWYWIALGLIIGVLGSAYYLSKAPKKYSATATLLIKQQTSAVISRDQTEEIDMRSAEGMNTVAERIRRQEILERVASRMDVRALPGLVPPEVNWTPELLLGWLGRAGVGAKSPGPDPTVKSAPPAPAVLGSWLGSWMTVSIRRGTRLLDVSFAHEVPEVAKALADAVVREHLAEIAGALTEGRSNKTDTLLRQSEEARGKLQSAESAMANYNRALELHKVLDDREIMVSQLARRYLPKHPKMIGATGELESIKARFLQEFEVAISSPSDATYWKTAGVDIEASKSDPDSHLRLARQSLLARTGVLRGEISSQMSVFNAMLTRIEESNVNREGEESSAEVSSFARVPGGPSSPKENKIYSQGAFGGLASGLLFAFILVRLDNKYRSVAQVEAETGQPVLAAVSDIDIRHLQQAARHQAKRKTTAQVVPPSPLQEGWDARLVFRPGTSSTNFAEMFRILRASISLLGDESKRKITLFSSALPGEGKSLISGNFALAAAGQGRKTLLIDLDLRKPSIHRVFGFIRSKQGPGVTEWLAGQAPFEDVITRDVGAENLHVIFSGRRAPNPGELLNVTRLKQLFAEASRHYDLIVVDSAPLLAVPDTRVIAPLVENFCLVVRANYVPKGAVTRTLELLGSADSSPSGLVFNGFKESRTMIGQNYSYGSYRMSRYGKPYQYGYGSYGAYGSDDGDDEKEIDARKKKRKQRQ